MQKKSPCESIGGSVCVCVFVFISFCFVFFCIWISHNAICFGTWHFLFNSNIKCCWKNPYFKAFYHIHIFYDAQFELLNMRAIFSHFINRSGFISIQNRIIRYIQKILDLTWISLTITKTVSTFVAFILIDLNWNLQFINTVMRPSGLLSFIQSQYLHFKSILKWYLCCFVDNFFIYFVSSFHCEHNMLNKEIINKYQRGKYFGTYLKIQYYIDFIHRVTHTTIQFYSHTILNTFCSSVSFIPFPDVFCFGRDVYTVR